MHVCYVCRDHSGDVYRFLNINTKRIIMSRDARWLNIIWKHYRMKSIFARKQVELFLDEVGMEENDPGSSSEDCYQFLKGIYGLCQAAGQFWKKLVDTAKKESFGFQVSPVDPCMLFIKNELGICIIIIYVDDMLIVRKKEQIQEFTTKIQKEFSVKIQHNLADNLGCEFHINKVKTRG